MCTTRNLKKLITAITIVAFIFHLQNMQAQNTGPVSPEAMQFEPVDATDMVNLLTGDFTYVLPILHVPSPEGGYPISLNYHAGVAENQEASWVGLGWNLNAGAINRGVSGYPDDWRQDSVFIFAYDDGGTSTLHSLDFGVSIGGEVGRLSLGVYTTWGSYNSFGGTVGLSKGNRAISISAGTDGGSISGGLGKKGSNVGIGGSISYSNNKLSGSLGVSVSNGGQFKNKNNTKFGASTGIGISFSSNGAVVGVNVQGNSFTLSDDLGSPNMFTSGFIVPIDVYWAYLKYGRYKTEYWYWNRTYKEIYGTIYSSEALLQDENYSTEDYYGIQSKKRIMDTYSLADNSGHWSSQDEIEKYNQMMFLAYDFYSVTAQGIVGQMTPRIHENGLLIGEGRVIEKKVVKVDGIDEDVAIKEFIYHYDGSCGDPFSNDYEKIHFGFDYVGNSFLKVSSANYNKIDGESGTSALWDFENSGGVIDDDNENGDSFYNATTNRKGQGRYVEWFTNAELASTASNDIINRQAKGFIETGCLDGIRTELDQDGIGAFSITTEDGKTYHYSLPVYQFDEFLISNKNPDFFIQKRPGSYAYTWLLTAITGPDFVDRGEGSNIDNPNGLVDENDWGYWVKFEYGKWTDGYVWKLPLNPEPGEAYTIGVKQMYYLNYIRTRTHTAYFIKGLREDGLSYKRSVNDVFPVETKNAKKLPYAQNCLSLSYIYYDFEYRLEFLNDYTQEILKLEKIILVKEDEIRTLENNSSTTSLLIDFYSETFDVIRFLNFYGNWIDAGSCGGKVILREELGTYLYDNVLDNNDLEDVNNNGIFDIEEDAIQVIEFETDYSLYPGSANSDAANQGKLSLKSVNIKGNGGTAFLPPYTFSYNMYDNIELSENDFDAWGYCKKDGYDKVDIWSLDKIITPLGANINIEYESDVFSHVGIKTSNLLHDKYNFKLQGYDKIEVTGIDDIEEDFQIGDQIQATGETEESDYDAFDGTCYQNNFEFDIQVTILEINDNIITFTPDLETALSLYDNNDTYPYCDSEVLVGCDFNFSNISRIIDIPQGGIRVYSIDLEDEAGNNYKTVYSYNNPFTNKSSGITSYIVKDDPYYIPYVQELPAPGVIYEYVEEIEYGANNLEKELNSLFKFEVYTPTSYTSETTYHMGEHFEVINDQFEPKDGATSGNHTSNILLRNSTIKDKKAQVGRLLETVVRNNNDHILSKTEYNYKPIDEESTGIIQETFSYIKRYIHDWSDSHVTSYSAWHLNTSSRIIYPSVLDYITTTENGQTTNLYYEEYDFITGIPLVTKTIFPDGKKIKSEIIPAYTILQYQGDETNEIVGMNSKLDYIGNKNMLTQQAASYTYLLDASDDISGVLSASIQNWHDTWNYRELVAGQYTDVEQTDVWRKRTSFIWKGDLNNDGTFKDFSEFNFNQSSAPEWANISQVTRYNHYSAPLEVRDINDKYAAGKMGYNNSYTTSSAANARYTEFAYSGAEDLNSDNDFFGSSEVIKGAAGTINTDPQYIHSGTKSVAVTNGQYAMNYYIYFNNSEYNTNRRYKASVWVHENDHENAILSYQFMNGGTNVKFEKEKQLEMIAGNWYLYSLIIPKNSDVEESLNSSTLLKIETWNNTGGTVYFDDFRFHPVDAPMTSNVYDEQTGQVTTILNNDNIATFFEYDDAGRLIATKTETPQGVKTVSTNKYNYLRTLLSADFSYEPLEVVTGLYTTFTAFETNATSYGWEIKNNTTSGTTNLGGKELIYKFRRGKEGEYTVKLTVTDDSGDIATSSQIIDAKAQVIDFEIGRGTQYYDNCPHTRTFYAQNLTGIPHYNRKYQWKVDGALIEENTGGAPFSHPFDTYKDYDPGTGTYSDYVVSCTITDLESGVYKIVELNVLIKSVYDCSSTSME